MRMILWYWHLDQPTATETALMKRNQKKLLQYKLQQQQEHAGLHGGWELLWWINPCSTWCWANTDLHSPSWPRNATDGHSRCQGQGQCGDNGLSFAEFSVCKAERWRMRRVMLWGLMGSQRRRRGGWRTGMGIGKLMLMGRKNWCSVTQHLS